MKILFLNKRLLFPLNFGGNIRTLNVLRYLAQWHDVTYVSNIQPGEEGYAAQMRELGLRLETIPWRETPRASWRFWAKLAANLGSVYPYSANKEYDRRLRQKVDELLSQESYDLVICDFVQISRNVMGLTSPPRILFQHNVEAQIFERHAHSDRNWLRRRYMGLQWKKMRRFEDSAGRQYDAVIAISNQDRDKFETDYGWDHVHVIDTAVNTEFFSPNGQAEQQDRLVFVGSLDWLPNQDGVRHFVERIWPEVLRRRPEATFQIVGRNPPRSLERLEETPGVELVGSVPDVRPYVGNASVFVVPLLVGGGTRLKIFEAMAMGKAVVSTSLGAEGLPVTNGEHIQLADSPENFAARVVELLEDATRRREQADRGRRLILQNFSAETVARQFEEICQSVVTTRT